MPKEWPGLGQKWPDTQIHTEIHPDRPHCSYIHGEAKRESRAPSSHTPTLYQTCSHPFLERWIQPRCQVADQALLCLSGREFPTCSIWDLLAFSSPLPQDCLKTEWQMAPGGLRWQKQGSVLS